MTSEDNFLCHYQSILFRETESDPFMTCSARRKCLAIAFRAANTFASNETSCNILSEKLASYAQLVDNKEGVNNYIEPINELISSCQTECHQWESQFKDAESVFSECTTSPNCLKSSLTCQGAIVTEEDITENLLEHSWKVFNHDSTTGRTSNFQTDFTSRRFENSSTKPKTNTGNGSQCGNYVPQQTTLIFGSNTNRHLKQVSAGQGLWSNTVSHGSSSNPATGNNATDVDNWIASRRGVFHQRHEEISTDQNLVLLYKNPSFEKERPEINTVQHSSFTRWQRMKGDNKCNIKQAQNLFHTREPSLNIAQTVGRDKPQQMDDDNNCGPEHTTVNAFRTARDELGVQNQKRWSNRGGHSAGSSGYGSAAQKKSLGARRGVTNKFIPPARPDCGDDFGGMMNRSSESSNWEEGELEDERLKNIDPKMVELIRNEIMDCGPTVEWDDIAGLQFAKATIQEIVVWPLLRPEIFTGLRRPPKGILLFGPPGTGKTLIGKCIASQSCSTFFSISASSLTSKWIGDGEKMVRALFAVARCHQPAVVFIDEIDSMLSQRNDSEHESSRRIKTEFLVQLDGATTGEEERILVIGATNRPQELDEAARRRLVKRLYIPLPEYEARRQLVERLMSNECHSLTEEEINEISTLSDGYSGADMKNLCHEASLGPIRSLGFGAIKRITPDEVRPISVQDFKTALTRVRASVSPGDLDTYVIWDKQYGSGGNSASRI